MGRDSRFRFQSNADIVQADAIASVEGTLTLQTIKRLTAGGAEEDSTSAGAVKLHSVQRQQDWIWLGRSDHGRPRSIDGIGPEQFAAAPADDWTALDGQGTRRAGNLAGRRTAHGGDGSVRQPA